MVSVEQPLVLLGQLKVDHVKNRVSEKDPVRPNWGTDTNTFTYTVINTVPDIALSLYAGLFKGWT